MTDSIVPETSALPAVLADELEAIKEMAGRIKSNAHLKVIVRSASPQTREQVYLLLCKYITRFKPVPYGIWAANA